MSTALLKACKSQGGLAKLDLPAEGITPMALNTLKTKADEVIEDGGWEKLNEMRKSYLVAGKGVAAKLGTTSGRTANLKSKLDAVEEALQTERRYRIRLQVAYDALLSRMKTSAATDPDLAHFINRHVTGFSFKRLAVVSMEGSGTDE
ncbi:hypothetical protein [Aeromonas rivipollensis]|uniref:hypothetical protein n=1 Tax=Aeromonas rivipollensis TaxID=948519 RepID=UPI001F2635B5|nr:hypothetical protein [Aeromonas rivipollensis]MCE9958428.1 hypothetical protein [Aeromonas rivipollensis]